MTTTIAPPISISVRQAAALVGISASYAYELHARGELPGSYRMGRRILVHCPTLLAWLGDQASKVSAVGSDPSSPKKASNAPSASGPTHGGVSQ